MKHQYITFPMLIINKKIKFKQLLFSAFLLLFGVCFTTYGQISLSVSPQKFDMTVFPGTVENTQIRVRNNSDRLLPITASVVPFEAHQNSGQMRFEKRTPDGPQSWVTFEESNFILKPGKEKRVDIEVKVPSDANPGGYYLFVYFEPRVASYGQDGSGPRVVPIVGVPFLISTTGLTLEEEQKKEVQSPEVVNFTVDEDNRNTFLERQISKFIAFAANEPDFYVTKKMPGKFLVTVKNNDLYHIVPEGELTIYNEDKEIGSGAIKGETILPGSVRQFEVKVDNEDKFWSAGKYSASLDLTTDSPVRKEVISEESLVISFLNLPNYFWIIGLVAVFLFFILIKRGKLIASKLFNLRVKNLDT